ncbi:MAG: sugar phosphate isomerase/epimerase [Kiritimatiellia bacterium]|jgi:sugar phosphate isomerase/epimerase
MNPTRRNFMQTGGLALLAQLGTRAQGMKPIVRKGQQRLNLSLAAYSFRDLLPNYRSSKEPKATPMDILGFIDYAATLDIDAVELTSYFIPDPCPADLANEIKRRCHIAGLDISGGAIGNNFAYGPGDVLDQQMDYTERWIKSYAAMGAPVIRVFAGHPKGKGADHDQAVLNIKRNLNTACDIAGKHGVILAMENHDFTTDVDRFLDIVEAIDSPWFGANLDTGNLAPTPDPYGQLARIAPYAVNAQVKVEIPVNGKKEPADLPRIAQILKTSGYSGHVVLEYEAKPDPYQAVPEYLAQLRQALG